MIGISSRNQKLESVLEICEENGYNTGLIANSSIVHATPASFYANVSSRKKYEDIAMQLSTSEVDYFIGGGKKHFNQREDGRNLIKEMKSFDMVKNLKGFQKSEADKIGLFTYKDEPPSLNQGRDPLLPEYLSATLEKFKNREKPFFVLVEGSQIDWGGHANDVDYITSEFIEFNNAIGVALNFLEENPNSPFPSLLKIISSKPENDPPQMKSIFDVFIGRRLCSGCFLPPLGGIFAIVPSKIFNKAC